MKAIKSPSTIIRKQCPDTYQTYMSQLEDILISHQARLDQLEEAINKLSSKNCKDSNNPPYSSKRQIKKSEKSKGNETGTKRMFLAAGLLCMKTRVLAILCG